MLRRGVLLGCAAAAWLLAAPASSADAECAAGESCGAEAGEEGAEGCGCAATGRQGIAKKRLPLTELERLKAEAVEAEDFEEAARLKGLIVEELRRLKAAAVEEEDFVEAARLKQRIEKLTGGKGKKAKSAPAEPAAAAAAAAEPGGKPASGAAGGDSPPPKKKKKLFGLDLGAKAKDAPRSGPPAGPGYPRNRTAAACSGEPNYEGHRPGCVHWHQNEYTGKEDCGMVYIPGGDFRMGSEFSGEASKDKDLKSRYGDNTIHGINKADAEDPVRTVHVKPFHIDRCEVTNAQFKAFAESRQYQTDAEVFQWSFVMEPWLSKEQMRQEPSRVEAAPWWLAIEGADWQHPEGPKSGLSHCARWHGARDEGIPDAPAGDRWNHPVVHVSWRDAYNFCRWRGKRLVTEAEWEYAARGGLDQKIFPWGDELYPGFSHRMNVWQGDFKAQKNTGEDGYRGTAPVASYPPNGYGLHDMTGNVWEWVEDEFVRGEKQKVMDRTETHGTANTCPRVTQRTKRGGSYMCHASTCNRYRTSARTGIESDSSTANLGFRCARDA